MKKFLALTLCALMMVSLAVVAFAADENLMEYNFEDDAEGEFIAIDNTIKPSPKQGKITVAKFDGSMVMKVEQVDFDDANQGLDCFIDILGGNISKYGAGKQVVVEYDVYFEKIGTDNNWKFLMSREPTSSGNKFQETAYLNGTADGKVGLHVSGIEGNVAEFETGKWLHLAAAIDVENDCFSVYVDGICYAKDQDYTIDDTSCSDPSQFRIAWHNVVVGGTDGIAYVDNIVAYNGKQPREIKVAEPVTTPAVTEPPVETPVAAPTADIAVIFAAVAAITACGTVVLGKKH